MNNLTEAYFRSGRIDEAIDMSQRVLDREPDNFHALANLARHLLLAGRYEEAEAARRQLQAARSDRGEIWCKKAETFSFFGDDEAVLAALAEAERAGWTRYATPEVALLFHLAGVACARQGNWNEAKRHWLQALQIYPGLDVAEDNLADAKRPIGERRGPWAFGLSYWIPKATIDRLAAEIPATGKDDEGAVRRLCVSSSGSRQLPPLFHCCSIAGMKGAEVLPIGWLSCWTRPRCTMHCGNTLFRSAGLTACGSRLPTA